MTETAEGMPWQETDAMKERVKFMLEWEKQWDEEQGRLIFAQVCREFGSSSVRLPRHPCLLAARPSWPVAPHLCPHRYYRERRVQDASAIFDDVRIEFGRA